MMTEEDTMGETLAEARVGAAADGTPEDGGETTEGAAFPSAATFSDFDPGDEGDEDMEPGEPARGPVTSSFAERERMARKIVDFEARRDSQGRIVRHDLRSEDGGGRYEVAGINERYHKEEANYLVGLIEAGEHAKAEAYAVEFIANYTDGAERWCRTNAVEFYLRDCMFNRGPGGAAWIVQHAVNVKTDRIVGPITRKAIAEAEKDPVELLARLRASREAFERTRGRDESHVFWKGLVNRWNNARDFALTFLKTGALPARAPVHEDPGERRILNCIPSPGVERDWSVQTAQEAQILRAAYYPEEVDLRAPWWPIADQGHTGSCVGWATADSVLRWKFVRSGRIGQNDLLSPRFLWMAAKETDVFVERPTSFIEEAGTSLKAALDVARNLGAVKESALPFDRDQVWRGTEAGFYALAAQLKIASYHNLGTDMSHWRLWIYQNGPILTRLEVDRVFHACGKDGVLQTYDPHSRQGGHAVALVGYTRAGFIVRNSWSTQWGREGYALATDAYATAAFTEAYGVAV